MDSSKGLLAWLTMRMQPPFGCQRADDCRCGMKFMLWSRHLQFTLRFCTAFRASPYALLAGGRLPCGMPLSDRRVGAKAGGSRSRFSSRRTSTMACKENEAAGCVVGIEARFTRQGAAV